jgi:hypothetical protein
MASTYSPNLCIELITTWVATAGYIALRANQNTPNASTTSIYVGASMQVTRI